MRMEGPALYIVATPIGNLGDFSPRAVEVLRGADFIAAEDTRVTQKLLTRFEISKPLVSYYAHNLRAREEELVMRMRAGEVCALVSDAGTPAISDPGEAIVARCRAESIPVYTVPGCCAAVSALSVSGLPTGKFCFEGFLSAKTKERRTALAALVGEMRTMIFYEAPHKLRATLADMAALTDAFYIGGTKNGLYFGEALVIVNPQLQKDFRYMIKNRGGMIAKGRLCGVMFLAALENDGYFEWARHANAMADIIRAGMEKAGVPQYIKTTTNQVFPVITREQEKMLEEKVEFEHWGDVDDDHVAIRFVTSWATTEEDARALAGVMEAL